MEYKNFKIGELFDIHPTKRYDLTNNDLFKKNGTTPVITNTSINNGIGGYTSLPATEKGNMITFSDTTTGDAIFYQPDDFIGYSHIQGLYPKKNKEKWTEKSLLYFLTLFKKLAKGRFDYATKFNRKIVSDMDVSLPINNSGNLDFKYMEQYINDMQNELLRTIKSEHNELKDKYKRQMNLDNLNITSDDTKLLNMIKNNEIKYKNIKIGELFDVVSSKEKFNANTVKFGGKYPYVVRSNSNNGIKGYITENEVFLNPRETISFGQDTATIFYQEEDYFTGDKIKIMKFKNGKLDKKLALYLVTAMRKSFQNFSWGQTSFNENVIKNMEIVLPYIDGDINYDFISSYMKIQEKVAINEIMNEKNDNLLKISKLITER